MKKRIKHLFVVIVIICIVLAIIRHKLVRIDININSVYINFVGEYDDKFYKQISNDEKKVVEQILSGYKLKDAGIPACGYTEELAFFINGEEHIFCLASDGCNGLYWKNKNIYFVINEKDCEKLKNIVVKYAGYFPSF